MTNIKFKGVFRTFTLLALLIGAAFLNQTFAQTAEAQVGKIRVAVTETNRRVEAGLKDKTSGFHYAAWTVGGERDGQQWAAVGNMKTLDEFWFSGEPGMDGEENPDARKSIRKIVSAYAGAADLRTKSEYVFDEDTGELIFAFTTELEADGKTTERRFYFNRGKLIRAALGKNIDAKFAAEVSEKAKNAQDDAKRLQNLFALMFSE